MAIGLNPTMYWPLSLLASDWSFHFVFLFCSFVFIPPFVHSRHDPYFPLLQLCICFLFSSLSHEATILLMILQVLPFTMMIHLLFLSRQETVCTRA